MVDGAGLQIEYPSGWRSESRAIGDEAASAIMAAPLNEFA